MTEFNADDFGFSDIEELPEEDKPTDNDQK